MTQILEPQIDEHLLIQHNIACAVSIVAACKDKKPASIGEQVEIDKIITEVEDAYQYALWKVKKYHSHVVSELIECHKSSVWKKN